MSFNNGNERRKLNAKWEQLRVQYREAGMSEEAIQAMYEFDLGVLNSERAYDASTVAVCDGEDDVDARKAADLKQYEAAITVTDTYHETKSRFGWIGEIENERLLAALESLSELDLKILTLYVYAGYTESEIASALESKRITMLSLPDDWDYSLKGLTVGCKDGLDSVRTAVLELEEHGYVRRQKVRNAKGQIIDYDYQVYESPVEDDPAVPGKEGGPSNPSATKSPKSRMKPCSSPFLDFPNLAEPNLEKATQQNTNKQNTKRQSTNLSGQTDESADFDQMEAQVREEFRERLEIDTLAQRYDPDKLEELLDNIVEMYCCPRQTQYVGKQPQTTKAIRLRLDKLTSQHVEYIFDVMSNTTQPIKNIMAYLRTTILNAPTTMEHYYQAQGNWLTAQNRKK